MGARVGGQLSDLPSTIGGYRIERELGRGGMGIVYLALDPRLGRRVAIKVLPADIAHDHERRARLTREARALATLNHPNIATLHALEEADGRPVLIMEHVEGESLAAAISRRPSMQAALAWCEQIARGMAAAHDAGILHRDLKPANIRIRPDGLVKVLDFGLARAAQPRPSSIVPTLSTLGLRTVSGGILGTPGYLSPEQARGEEVDRRADVFSFGCVLFECLATRPAFSGASTAELLAAVMRDEPDWMQLPAETPSAARRLLRRCLAKDPAHRLRDLADAALELRACLDAPDSIGDPAPPELRAAPNNLPRELTTLVGREAELALVDKLLRASPLVTLIGAGGCGKTRLAIRAARAALRTSPDGVWFIDLSALSNPAEVPGLAARTVGVPPTERPDLPHEARVAAALAGKRVLLVIDNAEHVLDGVRPLVMRLIADCADLRMLVTSREALGLPFEQAYRVPSLGLPEPDAADAAAIEASESGRLFIERARLADPTFELKPGEASLVGELCTRLDGIALAIELAAARTSSLRVADIHARLSDALSILAPISGGGGSRHATIRAAIEWSVRSLPTEERSAFAQLAVFSGGWTLAAANAVCEIAGHPAEEVLSRLVGRSLVQFTPASGRYRFLETVRQFASELALTQPGFDSARTRHAEYFLNLAERSAEATIGSSSTSLALIDDDAQNIEAALRTFETMPDDGDRLARLAFAMHKWWTVHGVYDRGLHWLAVARERRLGRSEQFDGRLAAAAGNLEWSRGRFADARARFEEAIAVFRRLGDDRRIAAILSNIAITHDRLGDISSARACHEQSVEIYERLADTQGLAFARLNLSSLLIHEGRCEDAARVLQACLPALEQLGDRHRCGVAFHNLGESMLRMGDPRGAMKALERAVDHRIGVGDRNGAAHSELLIGLCLAEMGEPERAAAVLGAATRQCSRLGVAFQRDEAARIEAARGRLGAELGQERFERVWAREPEHPAHEARG